MLKRTMESYGRLTKGQKSIVTKGQKSIVLGTGVVFLIILYILALIFHPAYADTVEEVPEPEPLVFESSLQNVLTQYQLLQLKIISVAEQYNDLVDKYTDVVVENSDFKVNEQLNEEGYQRLYFDKFVIDAESNGIIAMILNTSPDMNMHELRLNWAKDDDYNYNELYIYYNGFNDSIRLYSANYELLYDSVEEEH